MIRKKQKGKPVIDLTGPQGNAFFLMGQATRWANQIGLDAKAILEEMKAGDYEHLVQTFDKYFGEICILEWKTMTKLINLTAHDVMVFHSDGERYVIPPSGQVARLRSQFVEDDPVGIFDAVRCEYGKVSGLPKPEPGSYFIVSGLVLAVLDGTRPDCVAPDTGPTAIRDEQGNVVGVRRFLRGG